MMKAYLPKESLDRLWTYRYEGAALRYLHQWIDQLRWQRLEPFKKLAEMLLRHLEGILNYCRVPVRFGVVRSRQRQHQGAPPPRARIQESSLLAAESAAAGGAQDRIPGSPESGVGWGLFRFLLRAPKTSAYQARAQAATGRTGNMESTHQPTPDKCLSASCGEFDTNASRYSPSVPVPDHVEPEIARCWSRGRKT